MASLCLRMCSSRKNPANTSDNDDNNDNVVKD